MEIKNKKALLQLIRKSDEDTAVDYLEQYTNIIKKDTINYSWDRARVLVRHIAKNRKQRVKSAMVNYDTESGMISLVQFTRFWAALEDISEVHYNACGEEAKEAISDIIEQAYQLLGNIKLDRRIIFTTKE